MKYFIFFFLWKLINFLFINLYYYTSSLQPINIIGIFSSTINTLLYQFGTLLYVSDSERSNIIITKSALI